MSQQGARMLGTQTEARSSAGAVSAGNPQSVAAALGVLSRGGNAIDAVIAGAFAAYVAEPQNATIGGYGHLSAYLAADDAFLAVDHSPRAPGAATPDMFEPVGDDHPIDWPAVRDDANAIGGRAVAIPGAVAGLWAAHRAAGRLPWDELLADAIALADEGLEVTWTVQVEIANQLAAIRARPALAEILLPGGEMPASRTADGPGDRLFQRPLAATLRAIATHGPDAFYRGPVAAQIVAAVTADGGILTLEDLAGYAPKVLAETPLSYRGLPYITCADTVGYETLGILERFDLAAAGPGSADHYHLLAEAMGHAFADGAAFSCDPDHTADPVAELGSRAFAAARAAQITRNTIAPRPIAASAPWLAPGAPPPPASAGGVHGTTQVVAADAEGNLAALITTIGADFGARVAVPEAGIILNDGMVNYDPRPGRANAIAPGKMPFFAVPTLVAGREGRGVLAVAGSGGYPILAGVICTAVGVLDHGLGVQAAIDAPRVHSQGDRTYIDRRVDPGVLAQLRDRGHELVVQSVAPGELAFSRVSAVALAPDGTRRAGAGPAWNTVAGAL